MFDDLEEALGLSTNAGWNQQLDDWRVLLQLAPAGSFAAVADARDASHIVGTAIGIDYGGFGWIAMMLVDPVYRGCGIGGRLLEVAIESLPAHLPVRLDATPLGRPLYRRYGFEDEATLSRFVVDARLKPRAPSIARPLTDADRQDAIERDREIFGGTRSTVLDWEFNSAARFAYGVRHDDGAIDYCFGRPGRLFDHIGPLVALNDRIADALINAALAAADRRIIVDAFDAQSTFGAKLREDGFTVQRPLFRMRRGNFTKLANLCEYAIVGPEFG